MPWWGYFLIFALFIGGIVTLFGETEEERAQVHYTPPEEQTATERKMQSGLNSLLKKNQQPQSMQQMLNDPNAPDIRTETNRRRDIFCKKKGGDYAACDLEMKKQDYSCAQLLGSRAGMACLDRVYPGIR